MKAFSEREQAAMDSALAAIEQLGGVVEYLEIEIGWEYNDQLIILKPGMENAYRSGEIADSDYDFLTEDERYALYHLEDLKKVRIIDAGHPTEHRGRIEVVK